MRGKRLTDIQHTLTNTFSNIITVKSFDHFHHFVGPVFISHLLMYTFISKNGQLPVFNSNVHQCSVSQLSLLHLEIFKNLHCPVNGIYIAATTFHKDPYLTACALLSISYRVDNGLLFLVSEEFFSSE